MASLERTAYPRFSRVLVAKDLLRLYTPLPEEIEWAASLARKDRSRLGLLTLLKCFQQLHYFPSVDEIPEAISRHLRAVLGLNPDVPLGYPGIATLYRHHAAIRTFLGYTPFYGTKAGKIAKQAAREAAQVLDQRVDIINATIEELVLRRFELPAFSTLDKIAEGIHASVQDQLFEEVGSRLSEADKDRLDSLVTKELSNQTSSFHRLKMLPKRATKKHLEAVLEQLQWLESLGEIDSPLRGLPPAKVRYLASQAAVLDAANLKASAPNRRYALILSLIQRMRVRARDDLAEMFIRRVSTLHNRAKEELLSIQQHQRKKAEDLVAKLDRVLEILAQETEDAPTGRRVRALLAPKGDLDQLREDCAAIRIWGGSNHLPLLWKFFASHRAVLMRLAKALTFVATTREDSLLGALGVVLANEHRKAEWIDGDVDLSFCSDRWRKLVCRSEANGPPINRRFLEVCVFSHLATELRSGDTCIKDSEAFADVRDQLLPWSECQARLPAYCEKIGIANTAATFVSELKQLLTETAQNVDELFPKLRGEVAIGADGDPVLRRIVAKEAPASALALEEVISRRMPTRNLLDILANIQHWTGFTRHFGPITGNDPKIRKAAERYLLTIFAMGCGLGPNQAARHMVGKVTPHMLSFVNRRHMTVEKLEAANRELVELYLRLDLPRVWGDGKSVAADGTQYDFYDQNLLVGMHFRYRKVGAVAYRHVANNYIANFQHFIPPGIWEAIYVIEGLLKARLSVEADTVYSDTQGQSVTVFAFTFLSGINLMPRIRHWKDLDFFRPDKAVRYRHIDGLFKDPIDWVLIETHWQDLMQTALSIQAGKISSPLLLRRLTAGTKRNRLFLAAQELGRALRTVFLLKWISNLSLRQTVTSETNKVESYNGFAKYLSFGGDVIPDNEPDEQQKRLRFNDLVASAVILQNTVDMMHILQNLDDEGYPVSVQDVGYLSPYPTSGVKRFGDYFLDLKRPQEPWIRQARYRNAAKAAIATQGDSDSESEASP